MVKGNVIFYVTRQYMKRNRRRTLTTFIGIVFTVLLMTCVFIGKDTALGFMQELASQKEGKWHVSIYGVTPEEARQIQELPYVKETAMSADQGYTDFPLSKNKERPYLNIKKYQTQCFDWMNIELTEGSLPESPEEIVLSESIRKDNGEIAIGDTLDGEFFQRAITGIGDKDIETFFPFYQLSVKTGETVSVPQNFPYYGENNSFREEKQYTGEKQTYRVTGFIQAPAYESQEAAAYTGITLFDEKEGLSGTFNLSVKFDLDQLPQLYWLDLKNIAGEKEIETNNYVLAFSADSSDDTFNTMVRLMTVFFVLLIMGASVVLIYNVFNLSFQERSRYLGMLSSVGATAGQKRSSIYYEAAVLLLYALPVGILGGMAVVKAGIIFLKPYLTQFLYMGEYVEDIPARLSVSFQGVLAVILVSGVSVMVSSFLPARKIGKTGPISCIRGSRDIKNKNWKFNERRLKYLGTEGMLAYNTVKRQKKKTGSVRRAAAVFIVVLLVTAFGADVIRVVIDKKVNGNVDIQTVIRENEGILTLISADDEDTEDFQLLLDEIQKNPSVENVSNWYIGMFEGQVNWKVYSKEYRDAYHDIINQYYDRILSEDEFLEFSSPELSIMNILGMDQETLKTIADLCGADFSMLTDSKNPGAIVVQEGFLSTDCVSVENKKPANYRHYELKKMTDLKQGDALETQLYSQKKGDYVSMPLKVAGLADNDSLKDYVKIDSQFLWIIVSENTCKKMMEITKDEDGVTEFSREVRIQMREKDEALFEHLRNIDSTNDKIGFTEENYNDVIKEIGEIILTAIHVLLFCFVLLVSVICFMNLYNSISGWMADRQGELAVLNSVGMTREQAEKMVLWECARILGRSILWAAVISGGIIFIIWKTMILLFGYIQFRLPVLPFTAAVALACGAVVIFSLGSLKRQKEGNILAYIRNESI